ncbi:MAG: hypothetical protein R6U37_09675 [Dehalococcoidia bacterium]
MIEKTAPRILWFMAVLIPFLALVGYTISVYSELPDEIGAGLPKGMIFLPVLISAILPVTYGVLIFSFAQYLTKANYLAVAAAMDLGLFGLIAAVYLVKDSA